MPVERRPSPAQPAPAVSKPAAFTPAAAKPTAPVTPAIRPTATAAPARPATPSSASVDDARLRDLHHKLQQAKQQTKEANVSYEGLAKSVRATEAKLREQHQGRKIEFDVVIKDGKAVVKPIVR